MRAVWRPAHPPPSLLGQVSQPLSPVASNDALNTGSSRQHRVQDWSVNRCVVSRSRTFVRRLQTPTGAAPRRLLRSPRSVVQERLLNGAIFHTVKGRTPKSSLGLIKEQRIHFSRLFTGKQGTRLTTLFSGGPLACGVEHAYTRATRPYDKHMPDPCIHGNPSLWGSANAHGASHPHARPLYIQHGHACIIAFIEPR